MENLSRRQFLKLGALTTGLAALSGCIGSPGPGNAYGPGDYARPEGELYAKSWGMFIDMTQITETDIEAMAQACHTAHNVPNIPEKNHEIKWIWSEPYENIFLDEVHRELNEETRKKPIVTLCNHCDNPICVKVCPTKATFDNDQGIVLMDMHRCIGCRNCMAACPYGSRSFNFKDPRPYLDEINPEYPTRSKGVVEKCDFCSELLAKGEEPLCAQVSNGAIVVGDLNDPNSEINQLLANNTTFVRRASLGGNPKVFYKVSPSEEGTL